MKRETRHTEQEFKSYQTATPTERSAFVLDSYRQRDPDDPYATSRDTNLRDLEIHLFNATIGKEGTLLDLGCGNGFTILKLAETRANMIFTGVDFCDTLVRGAERLKERHCLPGPENISFCCSDAFEFLSKIHDNSFSYIITERLLLNLPNITFQKDLISEIARALNPSGVAVFCEGFRRGHERLNQIRCHAGLPIIPEAGTDNVSALKLDSTDMEIWLSDAGFQIEKILGFSVYFLISRAIHPMAVAPSSPKFDSPINKFASEVQHSHSFDPGIGSIEFWIARKKPCVV